MFLLDDKSLMVESVACVTQKLWISTIYHVDDDLKKVNYICR